MTLNKVEVDGCSDLHELLVELKLFGGEHLLDDF